MAEYKAIHGFTVQNRTSDPLASGVPGATWASGGTMNTGRTELAGSKNGTQSATITFGGFPPAPNRRALTELYNGTGWTEVGDLNTGRSSMAGTGTATAALATGGGIILKKSNQKLLVDNGLVIYLKADYELLASRLRNDRSRPLLQGVDIRTKLENLFEARDPIYKSIADYVVDTKNKHASDIVSEIEKIIKHT